MVIQFYESASLDNDWVEIAKKEVTLIVIATFTKLLCVSFGMASLGLFWFPQKLDSITCIYLGIWIKVCNFAYD